MIASCRELLEDPPVVLAAEEPLLLELPVPAVTETVSTENAGSMCDARVAYGSGTPVLNFDFCVETRLASEDTLLDGMYASHIVRSWPTSAVL